MKASITPIVDCSNNTDTKRVYGQESKNFGYKLMPEKLVEGTEGILQVYGLQKNIPIPNAIENLIVTSSDQEYC